MRSGCYMEAPTVRGRKIAEKTCLGARCKKYILGGRDSDGPEYSGRKLRHSPRQLNEFQLPAVKFELFFSKTAHDRMLRVGIATSESNCAKGAEKRSGAMCTARDRLERITL